MCKKGFTLAEVLITLAVVGIVAASTIPAVVTKLTRQEFVTKLQKAHNTLVNTVKASEKEQGPIQHWNWIPSGSTGGLTSEAFFNTYFKPHLDIMADCGVATGETACFVTHGDYKSLSNNALVAGWAGAPANALSSSASYKFTTSDGISYAFVKTTQSNATWSLVYVDVNGKKKPNQLGRDLFIFFIWHEASDEARGGNPIRGVKPAGAYDPTYGLNISVSDRDGSDGSACNAGVNNAAAGAFCTAKVLSEGGMNY
ncbi:pilin subunit PilA [Candidatus Gastranaerophilus sp. (ex Termes propinquus)]|nr:pilin subunit PilA [Candidatus Gastranaerophilus sp. (ex Termes propinquus)]